MIYFEMKIGEPQEVKIMRAKDEGKVNKNVTTEEVARIAQATVDAQQFKTINGEDIRGTGNIEIQGGGGTAGVNSINGKIGDIKIKTINGTNLVTSGPTSAENITIVQPFWSKAAVKCGLKFKFKLDESGNEVVESVEPYGYQDVEPMKHEFFQNLYSMHGDQLANIGLYRAFFERKQDGIGGYSSQSTYGTINTWGETTILNTEEDPTAENANYNYYVSFTVISPYTFQKYDVTVLSYYVSANVEEPNTWKIIWKKAN